MQFEIKLDTKHRILYKLKQMDNTWDEMRIAAEKLRDLLELPQTFLVDLSNEDDWSFVIKLQAFVESALTWALEVHLKPHNMDAFVAKWDLAGSRSSKVECGLAIGLLEPCDAQFIRGLAKIRNRLAHNVRNVTFSFSSYLESLNAPDKDDFVRNTMAMLWDDYLPDTEKTSKRNTLLSNPKSCLLWSAIQLIAFLVVKVDIFKLENEVDAGKRKLIEIQLTSARDVLAELRSEQSSQL